MNDDRRGWSPQDVLWELGASFIHATADSAGPIIEAAIERVGRLLQAHAAGVWRISPHTMVGTCLHSWSIDPDSALGEGEDVSPDPAVRDAVMAGHGIATVPLTLILGDEMCAARGWSDGVALVAVIDQSPDETSVLVVTAGGGDWNEADRELTRGVVLMMRQFYRRCV